MAFCTLSMRTLRASGGSETARSRRTRTHPAPTCGQCVDQDAVAGGDAGGRARDLHVRRPRRSPAVPRPPPGHAPISRARLPSRASRRRWPATRAPVTISTPLRTVQRVEIVRDRSGRDALQEAVLGLDDGDVPAHLAQHGRDLEPDVAAADDRKARDAGMQPAASPRRRRCFATRRLARVRRRVRRGCVAACRWR